MEIARPIRFLKSWCLIRCGMKKYSPRSSTYWVDNQRPSQSPQIIAVHCIGTKKARENHLLYSFYPNHNLPSFSFTAPVLFD